MAGKFGAIDPAGNSDQTSRASMMDLWNKSIQRAQQKRQTPVEVAEDAESEARTDLEQRIRNGQVPCPTCAKRTYKDQSGDSSVSFQAARHISAPTAGIAVTSHEHEHVSHNAADAREEGGEVTSSNVTLQHAKCPQCGRTYVAGGLTSTTSRTPVNGSQRRNPFGEFDITV